MNKENQFNVVAILILFVVGVMIILSFMALLFVFQNNDKCNSNSDCGSGFVCQYDFINEVRTCRGTSGTNCTSNNNCGNGLTCNLDPRDGIFRCSGRKRTIIINSSPEKVYPILNNNSNKSFIDNPNFINEPLTFNNEPLTITEITEDQESIFSDFSENNNHTPI